MMLKQLQRQFYQDVLTSDTVKNYLNNGYFTGTDLVQIYHNQYFTSLTDVLSKTYACVKRLVGEEFFEGLAMQFIKTQPSKTGNIVDYGHGFADFIDKNPHCQALPYLGDVARFEQLYEACYFSLTGKFNTAYFMQSNYPIIQIWQLNENSKPLDFSTGGDCLKIYKKNLKVVVERITKGAYDNAQTDLFLQ